MKETVNDALSLTKGYKQTEVGLIPEDWEAILLKEVCINPTAIYRNLI